MGLATVLLSACGGSGGGGPADNGEASRPADQILRDSVAALRGAESVHMYGEVPSGAGAETLAMDLHYNRSGNLQGTITLGTVPAGVVITGGRTYLKGRALFAKFGGDQAAAVIGDHWVVVPGGSGPGSDIIQGLATFTDFNKLADLFASPAGGAVTKGATSTVDGSAVVALRDTDGTLYVATTGKPYPIELKPDAARQALHFGSWDQPLDVTAPRDALDLSSVTGGSPEASPAASPEASPTP
jgi:hypothetical protein